MARADHAVGAMFAIAVFLTLAGASGSAAQSGKLALYTSQPDRDAAQTVEAFRRKHPAVEVEVFRSGTTEVMNKLLAEFTAGAPRPRMRSRQSI